MVIDSGYEEDHHVSNVKIVLGTVTYGPITHISSTLVVLLLLLTTVSVAYGAQAAAVCVYSCSQQQTAAGRCLLALVAQFYPKKWPGQWWVMLVCVLAYGACTVALNLFITRVEGEVFLFTRPRKVRGATYRLCCLATTKEVCVLYG